MNQVPTLKVRAPAKLNLFLHVLGQRNDGYHLLQSAFVRIDWCDELEFLPRSDGAVSFELLSNNAGVRLSGDDLSVRAAKALQADLCTRRGEQVGVHIGLRKNIPAQAGLGGGSSDAASTLLALNRLWQVNLPVEELAALGLRLGADVPFFVHQQHAWAEGIGEQLQALPHQCPAPETRFLVVWPGQGISTPEIFRSDRLKRHTNPATIMGFAAQGLGFGSNDLQPVAEAICPAVKEAIDWVNQTTAASSMQATRARMTGSGSAVFAALAPGQEVSLHALPKGWIARVCGVLSNGDLAQHTWNQVV